MSIGAIAELMLIYFLIMYLHYQIMRGYYVHGLDFPGPFGDTTMNALTGSEKQIEFALAVRKAALETAENNGNSHIKRKKNYRQ